MQLTALCDLAPRPSEIELEEQRIVAPDTTSNGDEELSDPRFVAVEDITPGL